MFKVNIFYPPTPSGRFDMAYYVNKHMPMVKNKIGPACVGFTVDKGITGGAPESPAPYVAVGALMIESLEAFDKAMAEHGPEIMGDVQNYTDSQPHLQISEVVAK